MAGIKKYSVCIPEWAHARHRRRLLVATGRLRQHQGLRGTRYRDVVRLHGGLRCSEICNADNFDGNGNIVDSGSVRAHLERDNSLSSPMLPATRGSFNQRRTSFATGGWRFALLGRPQYQTSPTGEGMSNGQHRNCFGTNATSDCLHEHRLLPVQVLRARD